MLRDWYLEKLTHSDILLVINDSYTYGEVITPTISKEMEVKIDYLYSTENKNDGGNLFSSETKLSVGTYYMYAVVEESSNHYSATSNPVEFTISKIEINVDLNHHVQNI